LIDRLKASELLGKSEADFIERRDVNFGASKGLLQKIAQVYRSQKTEK
jgi:hypothetical protein